MSNKIISDYRSEALQGSIKLVDDKGNSKTCIGTKPIILSNQWKPVSPKPLEDSTWEEISKISAAKAWDKLGWKVGDTKSVHLKGTVGTLDLDTTLYVYILGFDHNAKLEGSGITFGCFKTADGADVALCDAVFNYTSDDGIKYFNIEHWGSNGYGGWAGCDMRYDILGSTDVAPSGYGANAVAGRTGSDPTTSCTSSPVPNTLMAALPIDLRAVLKPMTKYSDNVGGVDFSNIESNISATIDYLPLLAEFEVFGIRRYANQYEQNKQTQYAYFAAGNSAIKYNHSSTSTSVVWWERSPYYLGSYHFCSVYTQGTVSSSDSNRSLSLAPIFLV